MRKSGIPVAVALMALSGCGKDEGGSKTLRGDMTNAVGIAIQKPDPASGSLAQAAGGGGDGQSINTLVKIEEDGSVTEVLEPSRPVHHVAVTDTHVVVAGHFYDVKTADGDSTDCVLVTFPRDASGEAVKCLEEWFLETVNFSPNSDPGYTVLGNDVFFTTITVDTTLNNTPQTGTELRKWTAGADATELLLTLAEGTLLQPATADGAGNVCVTLGDFGSGGSGLQSLLCSPVATANWAEVDLSYVGNTTLVLGTNLLTGASRVSLGDLSVGPLTGQLGGVPGNADRVLVGTTAFGLVQDTLNPGGGLNVYRLTAAGESSLILEGDWERIAGAGNFAYVYGSGELREIDLQTATAGTANLLAGTGVVQVVDLSYTTENRVRLEGTGSTGLPVVIVVNTSSGEIAVTEEDVPRFQSVTELE